jgi:hypothetical protein
MGIDAVAVVYFAALLLRFEGQVPSFKTTMQPYLPIAAAYVTANYSFGLI